MISRRRLMSDAARFCMLSALGMPAGRAQQNPIQRAVPSSGELLPVVGLGTYRSFDVGADPAERRPLRRVTDLFFEQGGRVVDSSPRYGPSEAVFGDVFEPLGHADQIFAATKVDADDRDEGIRQMQASAGRMGVRRIDLMQVHNLRGWRTLLPVLKEWKAQGRFRYIGISASRESLYQEFISIMRSEPLDFVQINYSLGERISEEVILPLALDSGMAVLINRPFVAGELFARVGGRPLPPWVAEFDCRSWAQFFLKFTLSHPAVTVALQATSDPEHLLDNMGAAYGRLPDQAERRRMIAAFDAIT